MSNHDNHRRGEQKRTETGPSWENRNPGKGSNSTHVAKSRRKWKRVAARSERRTGATTRKFRGSVRERPEIEKDDLLSTPSDVILPSSAHSSVVERYLDTVEVGGSSPPEPTKEEDEESSK